MHSKFDIGVLLKRIGKLWYKNDICQVLCNGMGIGCITHCPIHLDLIRLIGVNMEHILTFVIQLKRH